MAASNASTVRVAAFRRMDLILEKACSMGLKSGEYGGKNNNLAPTASIAARAPLTLWAGRLSRSEAPNATGPSERAEHVTRGQRRSEDGFGVGREHFSVHWTVHNHRRRHAIQAQPGDQGRRLPMAMGHAGAAAFAAPGPAAQAGHLGGGPGFVEKNQLSRIEVRLQLEPRYTPGRYVFTILLACMRRLFL